jgi:thiamine monophosphate kinase
MDVSDGLLSDVRRLAEASGVGIELDADAVPIGDGVSEVAGALDRDPVDVALSGGEDLELLVALAPEDLDRTGVGLHRVGQGGGRGPVDWCADGRREPLPDGGLGALPGRRIGCRP